MEKFMILHKEYYLFMENEVRKTKAYTNKEGNTIILLDPNDFYKGNTELFKSELKADLTSAAIAQGDFLALANIEKTVDNTIVLFVK